MSNNGPKEPGSDQLVNQLILSIKGLMILNESDEAVARILDSSLENSHDEELERFLNIVQSRKTNSTAQSILMGLGQLVLASVLVISGLVILAPSVMGLTSPQQLLKYLDGVTSLLSVNALSNPAIPIVELLLSLSLLLSAFYTLRVAATNLKQIDMIARNTARP